MAQAPVFAVATDGSNRKMGGQRSKHIWCPIGVGPSGSFWDCEYVWTGTEYCEVVVFAVVVVDIMSTFFSSGDCSQWTRIRSSKKSDEIWRESNLDRDVGINRCYYRC